MYYPTKFNYFYLILCDKYGIINNYVLPYSPRRIMTSLIKKIKRGKPYYYAVESKRVNGNPRIVWQKYLGTLDDIISRKIDSSQEPQEVDIFEAGGVAALLNVIEKLNLIEIIDSVIPKRKQGASIGQYIALAAINRVLDPSSKLQMPLWYQKTALLRLWKFSPETFNSNLFWKNMDVISEEHIKLIQERIADVLISQYKIDPKILLYDTTNFFTYIATGNNRNTIAQRGRNKAKRSDLRQVGLAMLVSQEFQIPLFHKVYQGNNSDRGIFPKIAKGLIDWKNEISTSNNSPTLVFDKGNISQEAFEQLVISKQDFVCAVPRTMDEEMFSTNINSFKATSLSGTKTCSFFVECWGKKLKAVLAYSESFFMSELTELTNALQKCEAKLREFDAWISKGPSRPQDRRHYTLKKAKKSVEEILKGSYVKEVMDVSVKQKDGIIRVQYSINREKFNSLSETVLGRTLIYTSRLNWKEEEVISAYRGQQSIENAFKHMKHRDYMHWQPAFHWTDQKIQVHGLYCVLGLLIANLAHREVVKGGEDISLISLLEQLCDIREVAQIYPKEQKRQKKGLALSRMSPQQKRIAELLDIQNILVR